ncbi:MAG: alpha/beta hydrolase [bacterium]|nr:alpha/beta hydrolase [bacterium]
MKRLVFLLGIIFLFQAALFAGGSKKADKCDTRYPIVLTHGMGAQYDIAWGITKYWNDIPEALRDEGATIYITSVNSMEGTVAKAESWNRQVLEILAVSGAARVNIIGHSHGSVYSRYAITNLNGLQDKIASHTSIAGPHRGSSIAELVLDLIEGNIGEDIFNGFFNFIMGDSNTDTVKNLQDLTRDYMVTVFNPNTPDVEGVYYQSYAYKIRTFIGAGLFIPTWPIQRAKEGANDGLVAVSSAKWGTFRGVVSGSWWAGVSHLSAVDMLFGITPGFDAPEHFVDIVSSLKNKGY